MEDVLEGVGSKGILLLTGRENKKQKARKKLTFHLKLPVFKNLCLVAISNVECRT